MKRILPAVLLLFTAAGCMFSSEKYKSPATYDLSTEYPQYEQTVNRIRMKNTSGADRRFLYRKKNNRMVFDEYNFWILDPEQLVKRAIETSFPKRSYGAVSLECCIERFEFDLAAETAVFELTVTLSSKAGKNRTVHCKYKEKFSGKEADQAAQAMDKCVKEALKQISSLVSGTAEKEGVRK